LSSSPSLARAAVAEIDVSRQIDEVLGLPDQLRDALWRVESAGLRPHDSPGGLVVAGTGGSSIGGALARAVLGDRASRPIVPARGYELPAWTTPETTVLCVSYSGDTEETLAVYEGAMALGAHTIVMTTGGRLATRARTDGVPVIPVPGGFQARAAVAYALVVALEVAGLCGASDCTLRSMSRPSTPPSWAAPGVRTLRRIRSPRRWREVCTGQCPRSRAPS